MPQFSIKEILASMAVMAVGLSLVGYADRLPIHSETDEGFALLAVDVGFPLIGFGALMLFRRPILGLCRSLFARRK
jgi:hypothetical protein